ncbi:het domain protein [Diplodia corticola]|uniref:Het domain protein n=1 Tax=Diplodia corticola TaxID=236234 RepID=A0A1J9RSY7_9PEZI|nr:het domain protein [Diplodia corticola]OJD31551.1 het domain protein [Diplodia corticola]
MGDIPAYEYTPLATGSQIRLLKLLPGAHFADIEVQIFTSDLHSSECEAATQNTPNDETERLDPARNESTDKSKPPESPNRIQSEGDENKNTAGEVLGDESTDGDTHNVKSAGPDTSEPRPVKSKGPMHEYDALSYTWGTKTNKTAILVKGDEADDTKSFLVTRNLAIALRYLRHTENAKILWIDALCINQTDDEEKSRQVSMMTQIYRNATQVKVWLGPAADDSDMAMKQLKTKNSTIDSITAENRQLRRALESLARREYWTRVWVVQEIFVGSEVKIICGTSEADWNSAVEAFDSLLDARKELLEPYVPLPPPRILDPSRVNLSDKTLRLDTRPLTTISTLDFNRWSSIDRRGPDWLLEMLLNLRHLGATDPRDKIFSMLGLLPPQAVLSGKGYHLRVDYGQSFLDVSIQFLKYCIFAPRQKIEYHWFRRLRQMGTLNVICASQPDGDPTFPTWLPDFSRDNGMYRWPRLEDLGGFLPANPEISLDSRILSVRAVKIADVVAATGSKDDCLATDDLSLLARLQQSIEQFSNYFSFKQSRQFWFTLVLGDYQGKLLCEYISHTTDSFEQALNTIVSNVLSEDGSSTSDEWFTSSRTFLDAFRRLAYRRRFAILKMPTDLQPKWGATSQLEGSNGVLAMVPQDGRVGDELYRLGDCDYLVLLRRVANQVPCFNFVGPCYIKAPPLSWIGDVPDGSEEYIAIY